MTNLNETKKKISLMSSCALKMLQTTFAAFMEHDPDLVAQALEEEDKLNKLEKELIAELVELGRGTPKKAQNTSALIYADIVADLEMIGDYCKDILERIEIKIAEKLLFSDEAVKEYTELYRIAEKALQEISQALEKDNPRMVKEVLKNEGHIDNLVDELRKRHNERLIAGVCVPIACNMYLNMLDFTAAIYYHIKKIARNLIKIK